jgi:peptidoglycan/xylan/chitin deacetylase (PgdA/CDA1 family)
MLNFCVGKPAKAKKAMALFSSETKNNSIFLDGSKKRKWYFRTSTVVCFVLVLALFALFILGLSFATIQRPSLTYHQAIERYHYYYSAANTKKVALTFDDGPNGEVTETLMDTLSKEKAPATFFFIGKRALVRPDLVKEASQRGFDVQDHSFTHSQEVQSSYGRLAFELNSTSYLLSQITGKQINTYRPPFLLGIGIDPTINPYIKTSDDMEWALRLGYLPVGSDIDPKDWLADSPTGVVDGLKRGLASSPNGHIILFHDDKNTAKAMGEVVAYLRLEGYSIVPLNELLTPPEGDAVALPGRFSMEIPMQKQTGKYPSCNGSSTHKNISTPMRFRGSSTNRRAMR